MHTAELQNSERQVAKLRNEGERLHFPHVLLQDVYKLEVCMGRKHSFSTEGGRDKAWVFHQEF